VTAFFIPGIAGDRPALEDEYGRMRHLIELEMGRIPSSRRILSIWTRRGSLDCVTQVGERDPLRGGTVLAIFDLGSHQPFVVWRQESPGSAEEVRDVLGSSVYSILDFER
jgi:hypothetical protein